MFRFNASLLSVSLTLIVWMPFNCNAIYILDESQHNSNGSAMVRLQSYVSCGEEKPCLAWTKLTRARRLLDRIDRNKPSVLYIHGDIGITTMHFVSTAYLRKGTDNVIVLDWSDFAFEKYPLVLPKLERLGKAVARALNDLVRGGLDGSRLHIVGHSLGAHIASFIARYSAFTVPGLDPASPGFYDVPIFDHITSDSAQFVDILHTDGGFYGPKESTGTVDFYANGGMRPQPNCPFVTIPFSRTDLCSHEKSWFYYAKSILNETAYLSVKSDSCSNFLSGKCKTNNRVYFGKSLPTNISGKYYFITHEHDHLLKKFPFNKNFCFAP